MPLLRADPHAQLLAAQPPRGIAGQEDHPDAVVAGRRQLAADLRPVDAAQQAVGERGQDARAVAGVRVGAGGAPMLEVAEGEQRPLDQLVVCAAVEARQAGQPAGGMREAWVVEAHATQGSSK